MPEIVADARFATFINTFRCEPHNQAEVVAINVDIVDQVASRFPGFISASVHRSTDGTRVINYLQWESAEHLAAMQRSSEFQAVAARLVGLIQFEPHQYDVVHAGENRAMTSS
jgi:heme-degrading monooxygenase HmoA